MMKTTLLQPEVLNVYQHPERNDDVAQVTLNLYVPIELDFFSGHFPEQPILPGVVQLDWVIKFAHQYLAVTGGFSSLDHIKFQAPILPDAHLELDLTWIRSKQLVEFSFTAAQQKHSSGRIVLSNLT